jgi:hypothetical protein
MDTRSDNIKGEETELKDLGYAIYRPFPDTTQVLMPLHSKFSWSINNVTTTAGASRFKMRMNSITDIFDITYQADNTNITPGVDTNTGTLTTPSMKAYWETIYRYFAVVACKYRVTFRVTTETTTNAQVMIYKYLHGHQDPPLTDGGGTNLVTHEYRQHHPHCEFKTVDTNQGTYTAVAPVVGNVTIANPGADTAYAAGEKRWYNATGGNTYAWAKPNNISNTATFSGIWKPGTIKHEVLEDQFQETWTLFTAAPKQHEYMTYIVTHSPYSDINIGVAGVVNIDCEYIVQLKDLDTKYQYLVPNMNIAALPNFVNAGNPNSGTA